MQPPLTAYCSDYAHIKFNGHKCLDTARSRYRCGFSCVKHRCRLHRICHHYHRRRACRRIARPCVATDSACGPWVVRAGLCVGAGVATRRSLNSRDLTRLSMYSQSIFYPPPPPATGTGPPAPADLISTNADNAVRLGTDGKLFVPTTTTTATDLAPDFAAGFNALISS